MDLKGNVVLVTGASRGIGAAIARAFAAEGACVIINYLKNEARARDVVEEIREHGGEAILYQADVRDEAQVGQMVQSAIDQYGQIDCLVNNALSHYTFNPKTRKTAWGISWQDYQSQLDGSLRGSYIATQAVLPFMKEKGRGRIINMVTNLIDLPIVPYHDYTTAKAALWGFTKNLARDLGHFGITVNAVAPGLTYPTDSSRETQEDVREMIVKLTPLKRLAQPDDIAGVVLFLASDWGRFVTGQCIRVDGGLV